jgi:hypothetical protein
MIERIIQHTYKRSRDDWYIFSNAEQLAAALGWRSIDCFLLFIEEELHTETVKDSDGKYYLSINTDIKKLNDLVTKYYIIKMNLNGIC